MRNLTNRQVLKVVLLAGGASTLVMAAPAAAQGVNCDLFPDDPECIDSDAGDRIVVTGSRIQRQDYVSNSPVVTVDEDFFQNSSTAAVEQQLNKLPQFVVSQSSTVKNNEGVLTAAGGDIQPNSTNTPGAATVSLRGVGANRSLVLIDGRRGTPGNATGVVDVSTIPNAALQRVEIISGGASATYGADAVAGVTNFILKNNFQGLELDGQFGISQEGTGFEYQLGGIIGTDFADGRGNINLAMSMNTREDAFFKDNPFYQDLWSRTDTTSGSFFFVPRPAVTGLNLQANHVLDGQGNVVTPGCEESATGCLLTEYFAGSSVPVPNNTGSVYVNEDGSLFTGASAAFVNGFTARGGVDFFKPWPERDAQAGVGWYPLENGTIKAINTLTPQTVPTTRYNFLARGNYEINDWVGVFGQGMFSNSNTYTVQEAAGAQFGWDIILPWGNTTYTGVTPGIFNNYTNPAVPASVIRNGDTYFFTPYVDPTPGDLTDNPTNPAFTQLYGQQLECATSAVGGCTNTQVYEQVVPTEIQNFLNATNANRFSLGGFLPLPRTTDSDVTTYNLTAGLQGSVPGTDFTWEAFVSHSMSRTLSRQTGFYSLARLRAVATAPNIGQGFSYQSNQFGGLGGLSSGFGATTGTCTTGLNFFEGYQGVSQDCFDAISNDVKNRQTTRQTIAEANLQGGLFDLPAGQLRFAVGVSYREQRFQSLADSTATIGSDFLDSVVGIYPSANMEWTGYNVKELYGELLIPILTDVPFFQDFSLEVGGRMSDYTTTGTSYTFKILGDWQVTDWLRFRGGFNRAERAPNIAELQLTPQQTFASDPIGDVCSTNNQSTASANPTANTVNALDVQAMCLALMQRDNAGTYVPITDPNSFYYDPVSNTRQPSGTGGGSAFPVSVGNQYYRDNINPNAAPLKPETADTWTAGMVIQGPGSSGPLSRLNLTVDYFNIKIKDPIGNSGGGGVLLRCVSPDFNPAAAGVADGASSAADLDDPAIRAAALAAIEESTCPTVYRNATNSQSNGTFNGARVITTYDNDGLIKLSGLDATISWSADLGPGSLFLSLNGNYMFDFKVRPFTGTPLLDYVGTTGTGLKGLNFGSAFEYKILGTIGYNWGPANMSLQWQHLPATEDGGDVAYYNGLAPSLNNIAGLPAYNLFNLNSGYQVNDTIRLRFGVDNLFNKKPPITGNFISPAAGQLAGGGYSFFHDTQGRRFSFGANLQF